jgi:hypothetical protein
VGAGEGTGHLSRRLETLDPDASDRFRSALEALPEEVGLLRFRTVVPVMQALRVRRPLNMLNAEALAAAVILDASLIVSVDSQLLRSRARDLLVEYTVV